MVNLLNYFILTFNYNWLQNQNINIENILLFFPVDVTTTTAVPASGKLINFDNLNARFMFRNSNVNFYVCLVCIVFSCLKLRIWSTLVDVVVEETSSTPA